MAFNPRTPQTNTPDRRTEPRIPARERALVIPAGEIETLTLAPGFETPCQIVDRSRSGLRLRLARATALPRTVVVIELAAGTACEAEVAWARGMEVGLKCVDRPTPLAGLVPARFVAAREAWLRGGQ